MVKLGAIELERGLEVEDRLEHALHDANALTDGDTPAVTPTQTRRSRQVIGMRVGLQ